MPSPLLHTLLRAAVIVALLSAVSTALAKTFDEVLAPVRQVGDQCQPTEGEHGWSSQARIMYSLDLAETETGTKPLDKRYDSFLCRKVAVTVYQYHFRNNDEARSALGSARSLVWGGKSPSGPHPERIFALQNVLVVVSGRMPKFLADVIQEGAIGGAVSVLAPQGQHRFDLDVPAARFSYWVIEDVGGANRLEADLEIVELRQDARWRPVFHVALGAGDRTIAVRMEQQRGDRDTTISVIVRERGKTVGEQVVAGWRLDEGQRFGLDMDWSNPGELSISSDGVHRGKFKLDFVPIWLQVSVSTGELLGHRLVLATRSAG